jgi:hypothetical protein
LEPAGAAGCKTGEGKGRGGDERRASVEDGEEGDDEEVVMPALVRGVEHGYGYNQAEVLRCVCLYVFFLVSVCLCLFV